MKTNYIPILKWKKGEQTALSNLSDTNKQSITPLIELTDIIKPKDFLDTLKDCYDLPIYLDTNIAAEDDIDYLASILKESNKKNIDIYPIIHCTNIDIIDSLPLADVIGIKIGVPEEIDGPSFDDIFNSIEQLKLDNPELEIDIILDLGLILDNSEASSQYRDIKNILKDYFIDKNFFNSIIICATSFPENLSKVEAGEKTSFKRFDYLLYKKILSKFEMLDKFFRYSDYGVTKFTDSDIDFSVMKYGILPKLKYTLEESYLLWKGKRKKLSKELEVSYYDLAEELISSEYYYGKNFSFGDLDVYERYEKAKKKGIKKCGNGGTWVAISANHHIAVVVEQLSNLF
ncbi:hypothetical protein HMPREF1084_01975 [Clostridium butyricum 60E.3]|uniref:beta family protein n=1 Tax=Clostridium butyricum TaxID=1492 RepID=UPI0002D1DEAE|nr:hypothetical protein [Clostridium butyricum]ALP91214.1 hypothetical protein ATN24_14050 [Clostridium butyricum]ANF14837.1 hypothetical protein AZ909_12505 [Clostridium butyricum]ENZ33506.1 hypothetical protein HMPREF1084_01975 [Clostridium butyricum 60E.3]MCI3009068.1 beta family protein [Clostridium butyricum]MDP0841132.1 hypothetical protein [Clostridium butyricum]